MRKLRVERTQWAVGNGFFHSSRIEEAVSGASIQYLFDCGALKSNHDALMREIDEFAVRCSEVDVAFISHFDFDHISGFEQLADKVDIRKFVIPMVPPELRVMAFAKSQLDSTELLSSTDFYAAMIVDPFSTFEEFFDAEVIEAPPAEGFLAAAFEDIGNSDELVPPKILESRLLNQHTDGPMNLRWSPYVAEIDSDNEVPWELRFCTSEIAHDASAVFVDKLIRAGLINHRKDLKKRSTLEKLVRIDWKAVGKCYKDAIGTIRKTNAVNTSSLMMYSGPPLSATFRSYKSAATRKERKEIGAWHTAPGWLGLGDTDLRAKSRVEFVNSTFESYKPRVCTFAPSHHGSKHDWSSELLQDFDLPGEALPAFVFGASGQYKHPNRVVIQEINDAGGTCVIVGREETSRWTEALTVYVNN